MHILRSLVSRVSYSLIPSKSLLLGLLVSLATYTLAFPRPRPPQERDSRSSWTHMPSNNTFSRLGFGHTTKSESSGDTYKGNVGNPYCSNIQIVKAASASNYKYLVQFRGDNADDWIVTLWNKYGRDGKMDGWYQRGCKSFTLRPGGTVYVAFDEDSQGGWAAAKGSTIPTNEYGSYASTWGEYDFGSTINFGWSGFDVSAIQAQDADLTIQGMKLCDAIRSKCSLITRDGAVVSNAYVSSNSAVGGIGGNLLPGGVRLAVTIDYDG